MKELLIMRHSKTESQELFGSDIIRSLTVKGIRQSQAQGEFLKSLSFEPQKIILSPSKRTIQTKENLLPLTGWNKVEAEVVDKLYHASLSVLLKTISEVKEDIDRLMLIGHNFGVLELVQYLSNDYIIKYKTGTLCLFKISVESWSLIDPENAIKIYLKEPLND